jgi:DNA-binding transcriptional LysR family regulator
MNIHHLELFYYVARHGGVSAAARKIPYGIQQPAISAQIIQLEVNLGASLFTRRPFKLSKVGEELFRFIDPFFSGLDEVGRRLRNDAELSLRIGAVETVQREYLPQVLKKMRVRFPGLQFNLVPIQLDEIESSLLAREIDIGVAWLLQRRPACFHQKELLRLPMALLVPMQSAYRNANAVWRQKRIAEPLIVGRARGAICRLFQASLQKRKIEWPVAIELNSQELIARYVAEDFGIGLVLTEPGMKTPPGTRLLSLPTFPLVPYGLIWTGNLSPLQKVFVDDAHEMAANLTKKDARTTAS